MFRRLIVCLVAAVAMAAAAGTFASVASAHEAVITATCKPSPMLKFEYSKFTETESTVAHQRFSFKVGEVVTNRKLVFSFTGDHATSIRSLPAGVAWVTAHTDWEGSKDKFEGNLPKTYLNCPLPPPPPHIEPVAKLDGPHGDPWYRAIFNNKKSDRAVTFRWRYFDFTEGWTVLKRKVKAGHRAVTGFKHLKGNTFTRISAHHTLLLREQVAPPGTYPWRAMLGAAA